MLASRAWTQNPEFPARVGEDLVRVDRREAPEGAFPTCRFGVSLLRRVGRAARGARMF